MMKRVTIGDLPAGPLAASGGLHQQWLPHIDTILGEGQEGRRGSRPADHTHREWRRAIATGLARAHTPLRVNVVAGDGASLDAVERYLAAAPGVTGQYLETDPGGAGEPG